MKIYKQDRFLGMFVTKTTVSENEALNFIDITAFQGL